MYKKYDVLFFNKTSEDSQSSMCGYLEVISSF